MHCLLRKVFLPKAGCNLDLPMYFLVRSIFKTTGSLVITQRLSQICTPGAWLLALGSFWTVAFVKCIGLCVQSHSGLLRAESTW